MDKEEQKERLKQFSIRIVRMVDNMPTSISSIAIAKQIIRSGTSPAANYRAACLGKSEKDFLNKLKMVEEELDETKYWLELIMDCNILPKERVLPLYEENMALFKIITSAIITTRKRLNSNN